MIPVDELQDDEASDGEAVDEDGEDGDAKLGARPRRLSELKMADKVKPIPNATSLFILKPDNRRVSSCTDIVYLSLVRDWCVY